MSDAAGLVQPDLDAMREMLDWYVSFEGRDFGENPTLTISAWTVLLLMRRSYDLGRKNVRDDETRRHD